MGAIQYWSKYIIAVIRGKPEGVEGSESVYNALHLKSNVCMPSKLRNIEH